MYSTVAVRAYVVAAMKTLSFFHIVLNIILRSADGHMRNRTVRVCTVSSK